MLKQTDPRNELKINFIPARISLKQNGAEVFIYHTYFPWKSSQNFLNEIMHYLDRVRLDHSHWIEELANLIIRVQSHIPIFLFSFEGNATF